MKKIGFITSEEDPKLISDDRLALEPLLKLGVSVSPVVWDSAGDEISEFDGLIFRSCWNYHRKFGAFTNWIQKLNDLEVPVWNSLDLISWNSNKKYLLELSRKGAVIPKTKWMKCGDDLSGGNLKNLADYFRSDQVVIKPAVSLNGHDTFLISLNNQMEIERVSRELLKERDILIQEFLPEVNKTGEVSLIFFNGIFSHAIRKTPRVGEFRVQEDYGGRRDPFLPSTQLIKHGEDILKIVGAPLLYARIDFIERVDPVLIELEIIDPMLFLGYSEKAAENFAQAISSQMP